MTSTRAIAPAARLGTALAAALVVAGCAAVAPREDSARRAAMLMDDLHARGLFQGAVVVGRDGRPFYARGFGYADVERRIPFTAETPTDGGSLAKTFTAAAVALLAAEGRVDPHAPVRRYVPGFPHEATRVRHLLAHSAGLPGYDWLDARFAPGAVRTNASHLEAIARAGVAPEFAPGSRFEYDNVAYDTAAMVIEAASGVSYASWLEARFWKPLAMRAFVRPARLADWPGARTRGYARKDGALVANDALDGEGFHGASNVYLSALDVYRWADGFDSVVGPEVAQAAVRPARLDDGSATGLGALSWYASGDGQRRYYTGHHAGFHGFGYADRGRRIAVAYVANDSPPAWLQPALARALVAIAEGREPEALVAPSGAGDLDVSDGVYPLEGVGDVEVFRNGRRVFIRVGGVAYRAFRVEPGTRYVPGHDAYLRVVRRADGLEALEWDSIFRTARAARR